MISSQLKTRKPGLSPAFLFHVYTAIALSISEIEIVGYFGSFDRCFYICRFECLEADKACQMEQEKAF